MEEPKRYGKWEVIETLGKGGQGQVFLVQDVSGRPALGDRIAALRQSIRTFPGSHTEHEYSEAGKQLIGVVKSIARDANLPRGALKELLPLDEAVNAQTARDRMSRELETLKSVDHASLVRVLDDALDDGWFVTEYFPKGSLDGQPGLYKGRALDALTAFRGIVQAVSMLHHSQTVHRDIKPGNVFIAGNGTLVLGDCGLAMRLDDEDRITDTYENVGTWDWMPGWAMGMKLEDVRPTFDVFSLGKLLWSLVSGKPKLQLWYFEQPRFSLERMFPSDPNIPWVTRILKKTVVQFEKDCLVDASDVLQEVQLAIQAISRLGQLPSTQNMVCRQCGVGQYRRLDDAALQRALSVPSNLMSFYCCRSCGHLEIFLFEERKTPEAWQQ